MEIYEIVVTGHVDARWLKPYDGVKLDHRPTGETLISVPVKDQSALHGILSRIRDMNLTLLNVKKQDPAKADTIR